MNKMLLMLLTLSPVFSFASPWIEADDVLLRAHLQALVDGCLLSSSMNTYPMRWNMISSELEAIDINLLPSNLVLSYRFVKHYYDNQRVGRGSVGGKVIWNSDVRTSQGFGDSDARYNWNSEASTEIVNQNSAFRLNAQYGREWKASEDEYSWNGSYFTVGDGYLQFSVSQLDRWWGPGWSNSTTWSQSGTPLKTLSLGSIIEIEQQDLWLETNLSDIRSTAQADYLWSSRLSTRWERLDVAFTYQKGLDGEKAGSSSKNLVEFAKNDTRISVDGRMTLFPASSLPALYASYAWNEIESQKGSAQLWGVDWQRQMDDIFVSLYIERFKSHHGKLNIISRDYLNSVVVSQTDNWSFGMTSYLANDDQIRFTARHFDSVLARTEKTKSLHLSYTTVLASSKITFGLGYEDGLKRREPTLSLSWQYRL